MIIHPIKLDGTYICGELLNLFLVRKNRQVSELYSFILTIFPKLETFEADTGTVPVRECFYLNLQQQICLA